MQRRKKRKLHTCFMSWLDALILQLVKDFFSRLVGLLINLKDYKEKKELHNEELCDVRAFN
jgi:hypothetical protein